MKTFVAYLALVLLSLVPANVRAQGDLAVEFRMSDSGSVAGKSFNGASTGHGVVSHGRIRLDMQGDARAMTMPGLGASDQVTIIVLDSGKTFIYLQPHTKQYMRFNPAEAMDRMQKMMEGMGTTMNFDMTGPGPKVENLGAGPVMLGHHTVHYRTTMGMKMTFNAMGDSQGMDMSMVTDQYLAPDLKEMTDPFRAMSSTAITGGIFGGSNKKYMESMKAIQAQLPHATELRAETLVTVTGMGQLQVSKTVREITKLEHTIGTDEMFAIPSGYTKVEFPMGAGASPPNE
jgi:hypothetical protein